MKDELGEKRESERLSECVRERRKDAEMPSSFLFWVVRTFSQMGTQEEKEDV